MDKTATDNATISADKTAVRPREPLLVLSDIHLDWSPKWKKQLQQLRPLWRGFKTVVFNGDSISWYADRQDALRKEIQERFKSVCREDGVEPVFIAGNSDLLFGDKPYLFLHQGKILLIHGHILFPETSPWHYRASLLLRKRREFAKKLPKELSPLARESQAVREAILQVRKILFRLFPKHPRNTRLNEYKFKLFSLWRLNKIFRAWKQANKLGNDFLNEHYPCVEFMIMGHTHRRGIWTGKERTIINTGAFRGLDKPWAIRIADNTLSVHGINKRGGSFRLGRVIRSFPLND